MRLVPATLMAVVLGGAGWMLIHVLSWRIVPAPPLTDALPKRAIARIGDGRFRPRTGNVGFTADGKGLVAGAPDGVVRIFDVVTGREVRRFEVHTDKTEPPSAATGATPSQWVTSAWDRLAFWRRRDEPQRLPDGVRGLAVSPDGRLVATLGAYALRITDLRTGERVADWVCPGQSGSTLLWTTDGRAGVIVGGVVQPWSFDPPIAPRDPQPSIRTYADRTYEGLGTADYFPVPHLGGTSDSSRVSDLCSTSTGTIVRTRVEFAVAVHAVALDSGSGFATMSNDQTVEILDAKFEKTSRMYQGSPCSILAAGADHRTLLIASSEVAFVEDLSGKIVRRLDVANARQAAISPDGKLAAIVGDSLLIVETRHWQPISDETPCDLEASDFGVRDDDTVVARFGASLVASALRSGRRISEHRCLPEDRRDVMFEPRGRVVASASGNIDPSTGRVRAGLPAEWWGLLLGSCGDRVYWSDFDDRMRGLDRWSREPRRRTAYSADWSMSACSALDGPGVSVDRTADDALAFSIGPAIPARAVALSADGSVLAATYEAGDLRTFRTQDGEQLASFRVAEPHGPIALSLDGARVACLRADRRTIELHDAATGALLSTFEGHAAAVSLMGFSADGTLLVSSSPDDGTILVWDVAAAAANATPPR